jgi:hypothetical protein
MAGSPSIGATIDEGTLGFGIRETPKGFWSVVQWRADPHHALPDCCIRWSTRVETRTYREKERAEKEARTLAAFHDLDYYAPERRKG